MHLLDTWQGETLKENLERKGVTRRDFMKMCASMAAIFTVGVPLEGVATAEEAEKIAETLDKVTKPNVAWLQLQECTGCMESVLRSGSSTIEDLVLNQLSVNYNELVMAASGEAAEKALHDLNESPHILVVNGSVSLAEDGVYCMIGGKTSEEVLREAAKNATAILAVGACAVYGSVQAARPNPTHAVGVDDIIKDKPIINVSGCPPIGEVITATITYILTHGKPPKVDAEGRPLFAYDQRIHDSCPRRAHFDAGQFVRTFDDEAARNGWCLYEVGCKGPSTFSPCPIIQWNLKSGWPIGAGHPCIGCTEKHFFDRFTPFYDTLPHIVGFGIENSAEKIGFGLIGAAAAGVVVHGAVTTVREIGMRKSNGAIEPLAAFGEQPNEPTVIAPSTNPDHLAKHAKDAQAQDQGSKS
ncbi:hydrogenase small subunit [Corynebacterium felinum]|uniref:Hydrogenase small subunit n=1 Tax=Corynebacterium felinum TaxID=131318 RepID=A0ABU2B8F4_9CORY|nr:hydrogenase small subunit [Corynebacterium felinum]MDF5820239.1 hydrogenase small subunit [Corynebacterium felinum]MDR7354880.1 hydrogenase small subunit [Corynebacterium felinum]WJY94240.1 Uptake hydrogenase small subunit precursor [Corynebacterium felinum]